MRPEHYEFAVRLDVSMMDDLPLSDVLDILRDEAQVAMTELVSYIVKDREEHGLPVC